MASGLPVVTTLAGGIPELFLYEDNGLTAAPLHTGGCVCSECPGTIHPEARAEQRRLQLGVPYHLVVLRRRRVPASASRTSVCRALSYVHAADAVVSTAGYNSTVDASNMIDIMVNAVVNSPTELWGNEETPRVSTSITLDDARFATR